MKKSPFAITAILALVLSLGGCVWYGDHGYDRGYDHGWHGGGPGWHDEGHGPGPGGGWH